MWKRWKVYNLKKNNSMEYLLGDLKQLSISQLKDIFPEEWRPVLDYEGHYEISNYGNLKSLSRTIPFKNSQRILPEVFLKGTVSKERGYVCFCLSNNGISFHKKAHRLVASAFLPNPENKPDINHLNGKSNNFYLFLEWCTQKENVRHAWDAGLSKSLKRGEKPNAKKVVNTKTGEVFLSVADALEKVTYSQSHFHAMLNGVKTNKTDFCFL